MSTVRINLDSAIKGKAIIFGNGGYQFDRFGYDLSSISENNIEYERPFSIYTTENVVLLCKEKGLIHFSVVNYFGINFVSNWEIPLQKKCINLNYNNINFSDSFFEDEVSWNNFLKQLFIDYRTNYTIDLCSNPDFQFIINPIPMGMANYDDGNIEMPLSKLKYSPFTMMHEIIHGLKDEINGDGDLVYPHLDDGNSIALMHNDVGLFIDLYTLLNIHGLKSLSQDFRETLQYHYFPDFEESSERVNDFLAQLEELGFDICLLYRNMSKENVDEVVKSVDHVKLITFCKKYKENYKEHKNKVDSLLSKINSQKAKAEIDYLQNLKGVKINKNIDSATYIKNQILGYNKLVEKNVDLYLGYFSKIYSKSKLLENIKY